MANKYKDKNHVGDVSFVCDPLLCLTRNRSADYPVLWSRKERARRWEQKTLQEVSTHHAELGVCVGVFLCF